MALLVPLVDRFLSSELLQTWNVIERFLTVYQIRSFVQFCFFENDLGGRGRATDAATSDDEGRIESSLGT